MRKPVEVPNDDDRVSDTPCPLGCGYRPTSGLDAGRHLLGHAVGNYTDGAEQKQQLATADES